MNDVPRCSVKVLTNMFNLSLVAYIAVKRMPDRIKLCKVQRQIRSFYLDVSNTQALSLLSSLR